MNWKEFGNENAEPILLLHGGGLNWWNYREEARLLQADHHVILPILPGLYHGEFSLNHPQRYAQTVREILGG